jgi:hypothetical protein
MVNKFSEQFKDLINTDVPRKTLPNNYALAPIDFEYAKDGFIANYCMEDQYIAGGRLASREGS